MCSFYEHYSNVLQVASPLDIKMVEKIISMKARRTDQLVCHVTSRSCRHAMLSIYVKNKQSTYPCAFHSLPREDVQHSCAVAVQSINRISNTNIFSRFLQTSSEVYISGFISLVFSGLSLRLLLTRSSHPCRYSQSNQQKYSI